jgi:hypothetical protein
MRTKGLPPLEERFEFLGDGMTAGGRSPLSSSIFEVDERRTGTPFNLKLWTKTSTAVDDDLRELWLHEMRQIQRLGAYEWARDVIVEVVDIVETRQASESCFVSSVNAARTLEAAAYARNLPGFDEVDAEARAFVGALLDFSSLKRKNFAQGWTPQHRTKDPTEVINQALAADPKTSDRLI